MFTSLRQEIINRNLSIYSIVKKMGHDPHSMQGFWSKKINGENTINIDELNKLCKVITEVSGKPLTIYDIKIEPKTVYVR